jgi:hypothetical protein
MDEPTDVLRDNARQLARAMQETTDEMDRLMPLDPMFDPDPVEQDTWRRWGDLSEQRDRDNDQFVAIMRELIARRSR